MRFKDTILIDASPEHVFDFFRNMDEHYLEWHPDHLAFRWEDGEALEEGENLKAWAEV